MSDGFDIKLKRKLESNADRGAGHVSAVRRIELITGAVRRRRWSSNEKARIVVESSDLVGLAEAAAPQLHNVPKIDPSYCPIQGPLTRAEQCLLSIARSSSIGQGALAIAARTAVYGPVCTVVWEGRSHPYPDLCFLRDFIKAGLALSAPCRPLSGITARRNRPGCPDGSGRWLIAGTASSARRRLVHGFAPGPLGAGFGRPEVLPFPCCSRFPLRSVSGSPFWVASLL